MQGWRKQMEDAHVVRGSLGGRGSTCGLLSLFGVFDGHGGSEVARFCSKHMPGQIIKFMSGNKEVSDEALIGAFHSIDDLLQHPVHQKELASLRDRISQESPLDCDDEQLVKVATLMAFKEADGRRNGKDHACVSKDKVLANMMQLKHMQSKIRKKKQPAGLDAMRTADNVGSTAVCVLLSKSEIICANAGDSRAVLCRSGNALALSHDHKPNCPSEMQRVINAGAYVQECHSGNQNIFRVNGILSMSRAIGDLRFKNRDDLAPTEQAVCATPDITRTPLLPEDEFIVVACDGVWDVKTNQEVCDFIRTRLRNSLPVTKIIEELLDACLAENPAKTSGLGCDNMTCIVVHLASSMDAKCCPAKTKGSFASRVATFTKHILR
jgi:protein phosphatase 1G